MKVFISTDMEGIAGFVKWDELRKKSKFYNEARKEITEEVNSAIEGIRETNKDVKEIVVCDSHAKGDSVIPSSLQESANLIRGYPRPIYMLESINEEFDVVLFIGYHSKVGSANSLMDHSYSSSTIYELELNDSLVGEVELNAGLAAFYDVPLGLVTGDDKTIKDIKEKFGGQVMTVTSKEGISRYAGKCRHPKKVQAEIKDKAKLAVENIQNLPIYKYETPLNCRIKLNSTLHADFIELIPTVQRTGGREVTFETDNFPRLYKTLIAITIMGLQAKK